MKKWATALTRLPGRICSEAVWLRTGQQGRGRPVAAKRKWCDHASSREAARADAESRWRRGRDPNEGVTSSARRRKIRLFVAEFTKKYPKLKQPKCLSDLDPMTAAVHLDKFGLPSIQST